MGLNAFDGGRSDFPSPTLGEYRNATRSEDLEQQAGSGCGMSINLPTTLLRSFVAIVETGSMIAASEQVFLSQSALSFQIKKLEGMVRQPLFKRDGRRLILTRAGEVLLNYAQRILSLHDEALASIGNQTLSGPVRVGMVQDFSDAFLRGILSTYTTLHPNAQIFVKVSRTVHLRRLIEDGQLDLMLGMGDVEDADSVAAKPMRWFGRPELLADPVVPLALLEAPCRFRDAALATLGEGERPYKIAVEAPNLSALRAAVDAGIGITCRTDLFGDEIRGHGSFQLPKLPSIGFLMWQAPDAQPAVLHLANLAREALTGL